MDNWTKYGNTEGNINLRIGIALPNDWMPKKSHMNYLLLFVIITTVIVPACLWFWHSFNIIHEQNGFLLDNHKILDKAITEQMDKQHIPFVIAVAAEFSQLVTKSGEVNDLARVIT